MILNNENMININELPKIRNGNMWYLAFIPMLAFYLESYAINIYMGIALWLSVIIICPLVCISDEKQLSRLGVSNYNLHRLRFIPPVYMLKRLRETRYTTVPFVLFIIGLVFALTNNGFTRALRANDDTFIDSIRNAYVSTLIQDGSYTSYDIIGSRIYDYAEDNKSDWSYSEDDDYKYVIAEFKGRYNSKDNQSIKLVFRIDFDGYCIKETKVDKVYVSDKQITGDERDKLFNQIFIQSKKNDSSSQVDLKAEYKTA